MLTVLLLVMAGIEAAQPLTTDRPVEELQRADDLMTQGKLDEAVVFLEKLSEKQPRIPGLDGKLGKAYFKKRRFQEAVVHLRAQLQQASEDAETTQLLGLSYYALGQLDQAIPLLENVQARLPANDVDASYLLGMCYLRTQQLDKARVSLAKTFSAPADSAMAHLMLAKIMVQQHNEEKGMAEVQKAISLDPRLPMAHFLLGEIHLFKSKPELALQEFQKELEINPMLWLVYWRLGDAYARLDKYPEAEKSLKQAIWLNETFTGPYVLLGQLGLKKGDLELAAGFLERAVRMDPNNYYAHYFLGKTYQRQGRVEDAKRQFEATQSLRKDARNTEELLLPEVQTEQ